MAIADWIREATERRRQRTIEEVRSSEEFRREWRQGFDEGFRQGYDEEFRQGWIEGYDMGYDDADKGRPRGFSLDALDKSDGKCEMG